jgi:hypothetical protein
MRSEDAAEREGDRHRRGAENRRQRPEPDFAGAEYPGPAPCEQVVQGRRGLAPGQRSEHAEERLVDEVDRDGLVEPKALLVEEGEPERRPDGCDDSNWKELPWSPYPLVRKFIDRRATSCSHPAVKSSCLRNRRHCPAFAPLPHHSDRTRWKICCGNRSSQAPKRPDADAPRTHAPRARPTALVARP